MGICCMAQETQTGALYQHGGAWWGGRWDGGSKRRDSINLEGWDGEGVGMEVQKGGDVCIPMADSC